MGTWLLGSGGGGRGELRGVSAPASQRGAEDAGLGRLRPQRGWQGEMTQSGTCIKHMVQAEFAEPTFQAAGRRGRGTQQLSVGRSPHVAGGGDAGSPGGPRGRTGCARHSQAWSGLQGLLSRECPGKCRCTCGFQAAGLVGAVWGTGWPPGGAAGGAGLGRGDTRKGGFGSHFPMSTGPVPQAGTRSCSLDELEAEGHSNSHPEPEGPPPCTSAPRCGSWSPVSPLGVDPQKRGSHSPCGVTKGSLVWRRLTAAGASVEHLGPCCRGGREGFSCGNQERDSPSDPVFHVRGPGVAGAVQCWSRGHRITQGGPPGTTGGPACA